MKPLRGYVDLSHGQVHYASCGPAASPHVLLLHQVPRSWAAYRDVLPLLGARYHAVAMDTPGFGASDPPAGEDSIEVWADIAVEMLDHLGISQFHVLGHHAGGVIAVDLAARFGSRVQSLIVSSTPFVDAAFRKARSERPPFDPVEARPDGTHLMDLWAQRMPFYPPDRPDLLAAFLRDALQVKGDIEAGHKVVAAYRMEDSIGAVDQPTLVIRAGADPFAAGHADEWLRLLPQAELADIPEGRVPLAEQLPDVFAKAVLDFLDAHS